MKTRLGGSMPTFVACEELKEHLPFSLMQKAHTYYDGRGNVLLYDNVTLITTYNADRLACFSAITL